MSPADDDRLAKLGEFIRDRRSQARLSLRKLSEQAGISNPYLSQIERGLRKPSAEILQSIAKALRISAETLYVQAGILEDTGEDKSVAAAIFADTGITERQKQVLVDIYESFRRENRPEEWAANSDSRPDGSDERPDTHPDGKSDERPDARADGSGDGDIRRPEYEAPGVPSAEAAGVVAPAGSGVVPHSGFTD